MTDSTPVLQDVIDDIRSRGDMASEPNPNGTRFAVDFNNSVLGDPYVDGTGYLPSREEAERVADEILPKLTELAEADLRDQGLTPDDGEWGRWTHTDPRSYAYIISEARRGADPGDDPVVEEMYP